MAFLFTNFNVKCVGNKYVYYETREKMRLKTKELTVCALFAALIAVGAFIKIDIPLPMYTMHFTLQWFFVLMAGFLLGPKLAALSVIVYLCNIRPKIHLDIKKRYALVPQPEFISQTGLRELHPLSCNISLPL